MITREKALEILKKYNKDHFHLQHAFTVEAVMRWFSKELGYESEIEKWGIVGLLHDVDFEMYPSEHCIKAVEILKNEGVSDDIINSIVSHGYGITMPCGKTITTEPKETMEKVLFATDELTGLIWAASLIRPSKSTKDMELKSVKKKYKSPSFAEGCSREIIEKGASMLSWDLDKLLSLTLKAMQECEDTIQCELRIV